MNFGALQKQRDIGFAPQQRFKPVYQAHGGFDTDVALAVLLPLGSALQQAKESCARIFAQSQHAWVVSPSEHAFAQRGRPIDRHVVQIQRRIGAPAIEIAIACFAFSGIRWAKQLLEFHGDPFPVHVQRTQKGAGVCQSQGVCNPFEIGVVHGQDVGLLVVQVLDAVLYTAQEDIGVRQCLDGICCHQTGTPKTLQSVQCGSGAQFGKLAAANHLKQLDNEFNLADTASGQLDVVGAFGVPCATPSSVFADLLVQHTKRFKNAVVQVTPKDKGKYDRSQSLSRAALHSRTWRYHTALEPGKALPFAPLNLKVFFQRAQ